MVKQSPRKKDLAVTLASGEGDTRIGRLIAMIDHCTAARDAADALDEKFLAYMLSMVLQEARSAVRKAK